MAIIGKLISLKSGLATIKIPTNPVKAAEIRTRVNLSERKNGAIKATHTGVENSKANICERGTKITA